MPSVDLDVNALLRVHKWLGSIRSAIAAIRNDPEQPTSVKTIAECCSATADRLVNLLNDVRADTSHSAQFVAQAMELSAGLADEWHSLQAHMRFEKPLTQYLSSKGTAIANVTGRNERIRARADQAAIDEVQAWKNHPSRCSQLRTLSQSDTVQKYLKVGKPTDRVARRLRSMLKDGRIK